MDVQFCQRILLRYPAFPSLMLWGSAATAPQKTVAVLCGWSRVVVFKRIRSLRVRKSLDGPNACSDTHIPRIDISKPANSNARRDTGKLTAEILIPKDLPITQIEIEVVAALLDDWDSLLADGEESE